MVVTRVISGNQGQYLTVPSTIYVARANHLHSEPSCEGKNILCIKLCACLVIVFVFCVLIVFIYAMLLAQFSDNQLQLNNDSLMAALVKPEDVKIHNKLE
ncbi:Leucine-rich single-pass membrane protein 1 [Caenorhabditis elegans]|uniref:Leucine-rich single-pass membrane protein 1 n=1 Tax=Caenorhabditis elegans TaxID=6239 RepID=E6N0V0_CAEEL|nr:Leucine-rich single-pass membrane protein 1 [Caenorhabditis elegans]CCD71663.2 Leucine-rich single-pass membrane protein 1 [Caenorhabditis elegans]